jgi:COP9 signalosome complex subunit 2
VFSEKNWEMALTEIFEAFKHYQEVGSSRAKTVLKLVAMASMLSNSLINPLESREAKVYAI